jgi:transcriptional regulator with XRE-family HTH domain
MLKQSAYLHSRTTLASVQLHVEPFWTHVESWATFAGMSAEPSEAEQDVPPAVLSINQVVAYNLMRARRRHGWTQDETADRLTAATGRKWTNATLSAAERSWQTGRIREFNANELVAFARVFDQPVAYFFLPPEGSEGQYVLGSVGQQPEGEGAPKTLTVLDVLHSALPTRASPELVKGARDHLARHKLVWQSPGADWMLPEDDPGYEEYLAQQAAAEGIDIGEEASLSREERALRRLRNLLLLALADIEALKRAPEADEPPPF